MNMDLGDATLKPIRVLGQGSFGRVFLCKCRDAGGYGNGNVKAEHRVCVKRIIVSNPKAEMNMIKEEVYIISQLRHPHIIQFIRSFIHAGTVNIVMEYAPNGTVRDIITRSTRHSGSALDKSQLLHYFCDMLLGLEYLHIRNVIHRDIKPENMLIDANDHIKIADFGISAVHAPAKQCQQIIGTPLYMAPEIMRGEKFCFKSDIWGLGVVLYEMCTGCNPFANLLQNGAAQLEQVHSVVRALARPKLDCQLVLHRYGSMWSRLCQLMIVYDVEKRIALPEIPMQNPCVTLTLYRQYFNYKY